ncbi:MAG: LacI family DNA-binding transcriptional regulator [Verrucomicrobia bacterium]|nr:LacI family DNA-binding transcriptional regulator [Verrucomicrobiota bacterium]MCH8526181.1 LacI family transcriptional regulator [Kiritimatiellia bacterium]
MKNRQPSLRDIAEKSGVHQSTVSRVLKNDPRISAATVEKVRKAAGELGYVPDPQLGKLMAHMRAMREKSFESVVGFLLPEKPYPDVFARELLKGSEARAKELGYVVNRFPSDMSPESLRTVNRVVKARGIEGLLLLPRVSNTPPPELEMDAVTVVSVTSYTEPFAVHEVLPDHVQNMELVRQALERQGAKRPGLISWPDLDRRQRQAGPRMMYQYAYETLKKTPLPTMIWQGGDEEIEAAFLRWFRKNKPDALVLPNPVIHKAVCRILQAMGESVPACFASALYGEDLPGVDQQPEEIGRAAVDMLTAHMQRNEKGWPRITKHMLIPGCWSSGFSA